MSMRGAGRFTERIAPLVATALNSPEACQR
jgi:hypothetical protein